MLGHILGPNGSERRPSAELAERIRQRWQVVYTATEVEHTADLRRYPQMFAAAAALAPVVEVKPVQVTAELAGEVINLAAARESREARVMDERDQRIADAQALLSDIKASEYTALRSA